jgi:CRISPR/Cas system-associated protein Cas10 (large subunit of type III CRISPR-Cas system)
MQCVMNAPHKFSYDLRRFLRHPEFHLSDSGEAGKNRAKILRGRSFAVSLYCELAADMLCRAIGIPRHLAF